MRNTQPKVTLFAFRVHGILANMRLIETPEIGGQPKLH